MYNREIQVSRPEKCDLVISDRIWCHLRLNTVQQTAKIVINTFFGLKRGQNLQHVISRWQLVFTWTKHVLTPGCERVLVGLANILYYPSLILSILTVKIVIIQFSAFLWMRIIFKNWKKSFALLLRRSTNDFFSFRICFYW